MSSALLPDCFPTVSRETVTTAARPYKGAAVSQSVGGCRETPERGSSRHTTANRGISDSPISESEIANRPPGSLDRTIAIMSQSSVAKKTEETARGEGGRFAKGGPGGPGRPKLSETRADQVRRNVDWDKADDEIVRVMLDAKTKPADKIAAYIALNDRGWGRPVASHELTLNQGNATPVRNLEGMSDDELEMRLRWTRGEITNAQLMEWLSGQERPALAELTSGDPEPGA